MEEESGSESTSLLIMILEYLSPLIVVHTEYNGPVCFNSIGAKLHFDIGRKNLHVIASLILVEINTSAKKKMNC